MGEKRGMKALELWCRRVTDGYPGVKVENMTTSWRDGLAFCALIHHFRPDLIDFASLSKSNIFLNNELAFRTAERHLGIPALLDAEDMVEYEVPDRLSILTYLSQFYQTFASHPSSPIKRSADSPDPHPHPLVLSPPVPSPSTKEGRRREVCAVCGLPVFLAQRLLVSGRLHHRTCFRCARCTTQLTLADSYETQSGVYCCETCPDEEQCPTPASPPMPRPPSPPPPPPAPNKTDPLVSSRSSSLVGLRRMMFETIAQTDDYKLPQDSDVIVEPNKLLTSDNRHVVLSKSTCKLSLSDSVNKSEPSVVESVNTPSSDTRRPKLVVSQCSTQDETSVTTEKDDKDEVSSLNVTTDLSIVETENTNVNSVNKLDVDSDLEPNSCSSDLSIVQAKNDTINNSDDEIEYKKLIESRESIVKQLVEAKNIVIVEEVENKEADNNGETNSINSENEVLITHAESGSLKDPEEKVSKEKDEFTSLTQNIEQLVIDAKNEKVVEALSEEKEFPQGVVIDEKKEIKVIEPKVPTPTERVIKHKPPTPQNRSLRKISVESKVKNSPTDYPEDLNPFGDDDGEDDKPCVSLNPFGSSDEDDDDSKYSNKALEDGPKPATRKLVQAPKGLNPFWSGDEEEEEEKSLTPVPKPRKLRTPQPSPQPSPQPRRLRSATGSLGSGTSIASRKKKPAPPPPPLQSSTLGRKPSAPRHPPPLRTLTPSPPPLPVGSPPSSPLLSEKQFIHRRQNSIVSETSSVGTISSYTPHKSMSGPWKRKKGQAPAIPVPVRRAVPPAMPLSAVRRELQDIEVRQQGLERQGVKLEQTIRDRFEQEGASLTPYVEEMVLQLFELVNEKNELFRRQAELMYLRRQHNLEEEHAELEYQIRCLMLCPEHNKTDSDKAREEQLIHRLIEVVERRNEIIDCLEMDRLREKEEDNSVGIQLGIFSAAVGSEVDLRLKPDTKGKKSKKEKRWSLKRDVDPESEDKKKGKKKWFTLHHKS